MGRRAFPEQSVALDWPRVDRAVSESRSLAKGSAIRGLDVELGIKLCQSSVFHGFDVLRAGVTGFPRQPGYCGSISMTSSSNDGGSRTGFQATCSGGSPRPGVSRIRSFTPQLCCREGHRKDPNKGFEVCWEDHLRPAREHDDVAEREGPQHSLNGFVIGQLAIATFCC